MDDDVAAMFRAINERFKKFDTALKAEKDERESLGGEFSSTDTDVTTIKKALGAWMSGKIGDKLESIDKSLEDLRKRVGELEKKTKK